MFSCITVYAVVLCCVTVVDSHGNGDGAVSYRSAFNRYLKETATDTQPDILAGSYSADSKLVDWRRRPADRYSACRFDCFAVGGDCVLHYPFCPIVLDFVSENLGNLRMTDLLWVVNFSVPHFFLLEKVYIGDLIRTAIWCDVISHAFNSMRAASAASASAWLSSSSDTLRARLRTVYTRVPSARGAVEGTLVFP